MIFDMEIPAAIPFQQILDALLDVETPLHPRFLHRLSDLDPRELDLLIPVWLQIPIERRRKLAESIEDISSSDYLLDYVNFSQFALTDEDPIVRLWAVKTLWDYELKELIPVFLDLLKNDVDSEVRAAAAIGLGSFVYSGEIEELPAAKLTQIEDHLFSVFEGKDEEVVQRAALESLGYSSRTEVHPLIMSSFGSNDKNWKASSLRAMGRSANRVYQPEVMSMLESNLPILRAEAARAAGELELTEAVPFLIELLEDPNDETRAASIWALSEIGGDDAHEVLERLASDAEEESEQELLVSALENLTFTEGVKIMPLFGFPEEVESLEDEDIEDADLEDEVEWDEILEDEDDLFIDEEDPED